MAVTWQRYAAGVLIAAGVAVTGTMFWERGAALRGEDVAALNAEIARRAMWYRLTGEQHPSNTWDGADVKTGAALAWRALYGEPQGAVPYGGGAWHGMDGARMMALCESGPLWLDAAAPRPADGDVIADCNAYYELASTSTGSGYYGGTYEKETWRLTATNHADVLRSAAGRSGANAAWPGLAATNAPLCRAWYGVDGAGAAGDWWGVIGNGETNYKYACEAWPTSSKNWPPLVTGRATAKKNLAQAYNVVTNLTRAAAFLAWDSAAASNIVRWSGSAHTGAVYAAGAPDLAGEAGGMFAAAVAAAASNETGLAQWVCRGSASGWYEGDGFGRHDWSADGDAEWYEVRGASLPWPCAAAFASGLVARVEIFAVLAQDLYDNVATPYRGNHIPAGASGASFTFSSRSLAAAAEALAPWARLPALEDRAAESGAAKTTHMSGGFAGLPHVLPLRLTRVAGATAPAAPVRFDVAFTPAGSATASGAETLAFSYTDLGISYTGRRLWWSARVLLLGWLVVVDWDF